MRDWEMYINSRKIIKLLIKIALRSSSDRIGLSILTIVVCLQTVLFYYCYWIFYNRKNI